MAVDRTQWKGRNLMMTVVCGKHALPVYWERLSKSGSSSLKQQQRLLQTALKIFKPYPVPDFSL